MGEISERNTHDISVPGGFDQSFSDIIISLNQILEHPSFRSSPQLSAFLSYVVSEELAGRGEFIKAYSVAVDALGRPESFDPSSDPVIRVIATRLRKALTSFYDEMPADVPIEIMLVRGSYRPRFAQLPLPAPAENKPQTNDSPQALLVTTERTQRRYFIAVVILSALLAISMVYLVWDLLGHMSQRPEGSLPTFRQSMSPVAQIPDQPAGCADFRPVGTAVNCPYTVPDALRLASTGSISAAE